MRLLYTKSETSYGRVGGQKQRRRVRVARCRTAEKPKPGRDSGGRQRQDGSGRRRRRTRGRRCGRQRRQTLGKEETSTDADQHGERGVIKSIEFGIMLSTPSFVIGATLLSLLAHRLSFPPFLFHALHMGTYLFPSNPSPSFLYLAREHTLHNPQPQRPRRLLAPCVLMPQFSRLS